MPEQDNSLYVQYGCGLSAPDGWLNFDASPTLRLQRLPFGLGAAAKRFVQPRFPENVRYGDVTSGLPLQDNCCKYVYCSHILEHLALEDLRRALKETWRILEPGGIFRLVLPDLESCVESYRQSNESDAASRFMRETGLGKEVRAKGFGGFLRDWLGNSQHLWMWDEKALMHELDNAGFTHCRRAAFGDGDPVFESVEAEDRWTGCLGMECRKG